jgi:RimJ/RimL family protein N-acetyltransferase
MATAPEPNPILNVVGEKVALGPHRRDLLPLYQRWINDFEITRNLGRLPKPVSWEAEEAWYLHISTSDRDYVFTIYERETLRPIGNCGLHELDHVNRTAEFGIAIGEKDCWGRGYGTEATVLCLDYGFYALDLHNIMLRVYAHNTRGIRAYERAGFRVFGRRREAVRRGGALIDMVYMDCLATEFKSPVLQFILGPRP